jgi:hypothetical protein
MRACERRLEKEVGQGGEPQSMSAVYGLWHDQTSHG